MGSEYKGPFYIEDRGHGLGPRYHIRDSEDSTAAACWSESDADWLLALLNASPGDGAYKGHFSDCALHNEPAYPAEQCDCGNAPAGIIDDEGGAWAYGVTGGKFKPDTVLYTRPARAPGEPVATILPADYHDERPGPWFSLADLERLRALPAGTQLFTSGSKPR